MKRFLPVLLVIALAACDNTASVNANIDSAANKVKNSETLDSLGAKTERLADSAGAKGSRVWDSTKSKGSRLLKKAGDKLDNISISLDSNKKK